ncbi:MAG: GNAT family N-acetyltransferase [Solirubrobacteraceae bacterium]
MNTDLYASAGMGGLPAQYTEREQVRRATAAERSQLASALAKAFFDDPVAGWCMPDAGRRAARLQRGFDLFLRRLYVRHDECYTTEGMVGAALWVPPDKWRSGVLEQLLLLVPLARIYRRELLRVLGFLTAMEAKHPQSYHYYLPFIGVEPGSQGRGIGSALMQPILERCDREQIPAYLEASSPRNLVLYERHGFEVTEQLELPEGGPPMWLMWREPRTSGRRQ